MPSFIVHRARITTLLFKKVVEDLEIAMNHYGEPLDHKNEEARSRFISPVGPFYLCSFQAHFYRHSTSCSTELWHCFAFPSATGLNL